MNIVFLENSISDILKKYFFNVVTNMILDNPECKKHKSLFVLPKSQRESDSKVCIRNFKINYINSQEKKVQNKNKNLKTIKRSF